MPDDQSLEGSGISEAFFNLLWSKDELNYGPIVNIPDTIVFKDGLPINWYFTSLDGRIKRKKREKLESRFIEESFTIRTLGYDILATFISFPIEGDSLHRLSTIEYLDKQTLHDFLHDQHERKSGILQRFIEPKGTKNDMIRAIWSPKICLLHRTENIYHLHDQGYGLYERCVTDEGPECFSTNSSLRGAALTDQIHKVCDMAVTHISAVTYGRKQVSRLVMNLKVDSRDKLWLLHTTSINCHCDLLGSNEETIGRMIKKPLSEKKVLLNIGNVFSLPDVVNLNPVKSYGDISARKSKHRVRCVSCNEETLEHSRHPVSYKSIVKHYEHVLHLLQDNQSQTQTSKNKVASTVSVSVSRRSYLIRWPPDPEIITAAGGVGFGCIDLINVNNDSSSNIPKVTSTEIDDNNADLNIPPILRCIHPKLDAKSYELCRRDPIFLFKTVQVCESCFLVYAEFTTILLRMGQNLTTFLKSKLSIRKIDDRSTTMSRPSSADWRAMSVHRQSTELVNGSPPGRSPVVFNPSDNHVLAKNSAIGLRSSDTRRIPGIPIMIRGGCTQVRAQSSRGSHGECSSGHDSPVTSVNQGESKGYSVCENISILSSNQSSTKCNLIEFGKYQADIGESPYMCNQPAIHRQRKTVNRKCHNQI